MTPSELKAKHLETNPSSNFFKRRTMSFFGDTMKNYGVTGPYQVHDSSGNAVQVFELYRKRPVRHNLNSSSYFCSTTFRRVFPCPNSNN
jgi:hypothetical protein